MCKYDLVINNDLFYVLEVLLKVFVVYELVYFKEKDYNKVFYKFCCYMELDYY